MMRLLLKVFLCSFFVCSALCANDMSLVGQTEQSIAPTQDQSKTKTITLLDIELSDEAQRTLYERTQNLLLADEQAQRRRLNTTTETRAAQVQLGMNQVPVLDQGQHGTCSTFAITAAIDAALKKGNYVSQLCLLELGRHFENQAQGNSGWDGISTQAIINRIHRYGIITQAYQHKYGCAGVTEYPYFSTPQIEMTPEDYLQHHEVVSENKAQWTSIFNKPAQSVLTDSQYAQIINKTKEALHAGHRLVVGVLLPRSDLGSGGAVAWHYFLYDTWVLTHEMAQDLQYSKHISGHALIVTGYDDKAKAMDSSGKEHHGLFTVRNSWGSFAGYKGDFYMSYDYFKTLVTDIYHRTYEKLIKTEGFCSSWIR